MRHDIEELERVALDMCLRNDFMHRWGKYSLAAWLRYGCECAYCGRSMIEDRGTAYFLGCVEHILPKSKYPGLENQFTNYALACRYCNQVKLRWDPNEESGEEALVGRNATSLTGEQHEILVERARRYVQEHKLSLENEFDNEKKLIMGFLQPKVKASEP